MANDNYNKLEALLSHLSERGRVLLGCCLAEHAAPIFETIEGEGAAAALLEGLWSAGSGDSDAGLAATTEAFAESVPQMSEEEWMPRNDVAMRSGVALLEAADLVADPGDEEKAVRAVMAVFDLLVSAELLRDESFQLDFELIDRVHLAGDVPAEAHDEWLAVASTVQKLTDAEPEPDKIRDEHSQRGRLLASAYLGRRPA